MALTAGRKKLVVVVLLPARMNEWLEANGQDTSGRTRDPVIPIVFDTESVTLSVLQLPS
jgi:hypothetical protein